MPVGTVFALESANYGKGILLGAGDRDLAGIVRGAWNVRGPLEREAAWEILPVDFANRASFSIPASEAQEILASMGVNIPARIYGRPEADAVIRDLRGGVPLTQAQTREFLLRAGAPASITADQAIVITVSQLSAQGSARQSGPATRPTTMPTGSK